MVHEACRFRATPMEVTEWLRGLGLEQYAPAFRDNELTGLRRLTAEDLRELGIASIGHRRRLLDAIAALRDRQPTAGAPPAPVPATTAAGEAERSQLTVMFCDLVGSTPLSARLDPENLRGIIGSYHRCGAETVESFGGFVARYMGDGALVYFGYPRAHEDDAERATRCGLARVDRVPASRRRPFGLSWVCARLLRSFGSGCRVPPAMSHTSCRRALGSDRHGDGAALRCRHGLGGRWEEMLPSRPKRLGDRSETRCRPTLGRSLRLLRGCSEQAPAPPRSRELDPSLEHALPTRYRRRRGRKAQSLVDSTEHPQCEGVPNLRCSTAKLAELVGDIAMARLELETLLKMGMGAGKIDCSLPRVDNCWRPWEIGCRFFTGPERSRDCWFGRSRRCLSRGLVVLAVS